MVKFCPSLSRAFSNAPNLVQKKTHILFYRSSPTLFPKCPDNSAKTAAGAAAPPTTGQGRPRAREGGQGEIFHLVHPLIFSNCPLGWDWLLVGRSGCVSRQPSAPQQLPLSSLPLCNSCHGRKLGGVWARKVTQYGCRSRTLMEMEKQHPDE